MRMLYAVIPLLLSTMAACRSVPEADTYTYEDDCANPGLVDVPVPMAEFVADSDDFSCFLDAQQSQYNPAERWYSVRSFFVRNLAGRTQETLDVACGRKPGPYPVGTILQLVFFEAMAKRGGDFAPEASGWEFFALDVSSPEQPGAEAHTSIASRGVTETVNFAGGNCFNCHKQAKPEADFVCESVNGCDPIPVDADLLVKFQQGDPRCQ
jgi:hypothetical protein